LYIILSWYAVCQTYYSIRSICVSNAYCVVNYVMELLDVRSCQMIQYHKALIKMKSVINKWLMIGCLVFTRIGFSKVGQAWIFHA